MIGIIYKVTNSINGKVYIGQTVKNIGQRRRDHLFRAKKGDERTAFQIALLESGKDNFNWEQIDTAETKEELDEKEKKWIEHYKSNNPLYGYNLQSGGKIKYKNNNETRSKMSNSQKGNKNFLGKYHSIETRQRMSNSHKGNKNMLGKHLSIETRQKMSNSQKGHTVAIDVCKKLSLAQRGEKGSNAKLTEFQVKKIKTAIASGESCASLGRKYHVNAVTINNIKTGRTWSHIN